MASIPHYQPVGLVSFEDFLHADGCRMVRLRSYNSLELLVAGTRTSEVFSRDVSTMEGLSRGTVGDAAKRCGSREETPRSTAGLGFSSGSDVWKSGWESCDVGALALCCVLALPLFVIHLSFECDKAKVVPASAR